MIFSGTFEGLASSPYVKGSKETSMKQINSSRLIVSPELLGTSGCVRRKVMAAHAEITFPNSTTVKSISVAEKENMCSLSWFCRFTK